MSKRDRKSWRPESPRLDELRNLKSKGFDASARVPADRVYCLAGLAACLVLFVVLFRSTLRDLAHVWSEEQDYSHGYLVIPLALILLWMRRDLLPDVVGVPGWGGLLILVLSFAVRYLGERFYLVPMAGYSLLLWLIGSIWLIFGRRICFWALPGILFLFFMIPLPFRIEQLASWRLQTITTHVSTFIFQCLGQPTIAEGHRIYLQDTVLEVEQACSGLRMFMGITAVAYTCVFINGQSIWEKCVILLAIAPVAILSNALRVVVTGELMLLVSGEAAQKFSHDFAGALMIVVAVVLFVGLRLYLSRLFVAMEAETGSLLLKKTNPLAGA